MKVILLAEDDENGILLVQRAFKEVHILNPLQVVRDGEEVIAYLKGAGQYANRADYPLPALLLLDLKMPRKNGFEVLQWIRSEPALLSLRVIVLTSSTELHDLNEAYRLGASSFLVKPQDFNDFITLFKSLHSYWLLTDRSPEVGQPENNTGQPNSSNGTGSDGAGGG